MGSCAAPSWEQFWQGLNSSSVGSACLGDAPRLTLWPAPALSRPPVQPLMLLCAANPTPSGCGAGQALLG